MSSSLPIWPSSLLKGHHYGVCGLGRNGSSVVQALLQLGATVQAWDDTAPSLPEHPNLTLAPLTDLNSMKALILSPGIPHHLPTSHPAAILARSQNIPIFSDAELLWKVTRLAGSKARFISVTGTNGKSTTTALLTHILNYADIPVAAGGNIGAAALSLPALGNDGVYVIEMSSYMLERLEEFHANIAIFLNLTADHLERHGDMNGYCRAKAHVFDHMTDHDLAILGEEAPWSAPLIASLTARHVPTYITKISTNLSQHDAPMLPGRHNIQNIEACRAAAQHLGIDKTTITKAIHSFPGLAHRLQYVTTINHIECINDSKATNADATAHALATYDKVVWIAGGQAKEGGIKNLSPYFPHIGYAFLIGHDAPQLSKTLKQYGIPHEVVQTLDKAVPAALEYARNQNIPTVLFSPACASFDQFRNFEERGEHFCHLISSYADTHKE